MANKSSKDYARELCLKSKALKQRAFFSNVSFEESQELRKKQNEVYQKYIFAKKFMEAKDKVNSQKKK